MKLAIFLCAIIFSLHGYCASVNPSHLTARTIASGHETVENVKVKGKTNRLLLLDKKREVIIGWGLIAYLTLLFWWAITAKNSLDKILENVLQDIARYPS